MHYFWNGFEKRAYDYAYEADQLRTKYDAQSKRTPLSARAGVASGLTAGGLMGAVGGALGATSGRRGIGALAGGAAGLGLGGLFGYVAAIADKLGVEEAKRIMAMDPVEQKKYLAYLARQGEISSAEHRDWSRRLYEQADRNNKHQELVSALKVKS